jgi:hypothetical protein
MGGYKTVILPLFVNPRHLQAFYKLGCFHTIPENSWFLLTIRVKVCPIFCGIERPPFEIGICHVTEGAVLLSGKGTKSGKRELKV